jgi:hypothetical protein
VEAWDPKVLRVTKEMLELKDLLVRKVILDLRVPLGSKDQRDRKVQ